MGAIKRRTVRIGTRKSRLALVQTNMVAEAIEAACPEVKCELVPLMTRGDKILKTSLVAFGGKGAFVEEFEQSILNGDIDLAVHSAKDMPMDLSDGLCIGAVLKREDPRDVFVTVKGRTPERSPRIIGTGSPRRQVQMWNAACSAETLIRDWKSCIRESTMGSFWLRLVLIVWVFLMIRDFPLSFWNRKCLSRQEVRGSSQWKRKRAVRY